MAISPSIMTTYGRIDIAFTHGKGSFLFSEDGNRFLDYASGIAVNAFGHCHPKLVEALTEQANKLWHTSNLYRIPEQEVVAEKLVANSCAERVFFCNSGAEATEGAVKVARRYAWANGEKDRTEILCATGAFHGRTLAMLAANDRPLFREGFGPSAQGFTHVEWGNIESLKKLIGRHVAAILVEPVQGEGGARKAPDGYLKLLKDIALENGSLLISDEVQIGMGRSGTLFAYQQEEIEPDIIALAKGLGGGFPVGAVMAKAEVGDAMVPGTHGSTFGGNPVIAAASLATLRELRDSQIIFQINKKEALFRQELKHKKIKEIRGKGLMLALIVENPETANKIIFKCLDKGLILFWLLWEKNAIRISPPLTIKEKEIIRGCRIIQEVLDSI